VERASLKVLLLSVVEVREEAAFVDAAVEDLLIELEDSR